MKETTEATEGRKGDERRETREEIDNFSLFAPRFSQIALCG